MTQSENEGDCGPWVDSVGHAHEKALGKVDKLGLALVLRETGYAVADGELRGSCSVQVDRAEDAVTGRERRLFLEGIGAATHVDV